MTSTDPSVEERLGCCCCCSCYCIFISNASKKWKTDVKIMIGVESFDIKNVADLKKNRKMSMVPNLIHHIHHYLWVPPYQHHTPSLKLKPPTEVG